MLDTEPTFTDSLFMDGLTDRQREILNFVRGYAMERGYWPSFREIQKHFGFKSTNAVMGHLRALESKGAIERMAGQARTFRIVPEVPDEAIEVTDLPIYGAIAAGYPDGVEQGDALGRLQVDVVTAGANRGRRNFALRVAGDSMIDAGIFDGDTVVIESRPARAGEIVVALIDGLSTLKRLVRGENGLPYLKSENKAYPELRPMSELVVQGVASSVVRRL